VPIRDKLSPIAETVTLKDHTFKVLRDAILDMDIYSPDANLRLDERALAEQLGISRTPIREALARLEHDGLVEIIPRKGVFVSRKTREEVLEIGGEALNGTLSRCDNTTCMTSPSMMYSLMRSTAFSKPSRVKPDTKSFSPCTCGAAAAWR